MTCCFHRWVENVKEECDSPGEFFYDQQTDELYFNFNGSDPTGTEEWVATSTRVLFNISGTMKQPVRAITIHGLTLRDTRLTYLDAHGMPSGQQGPCLP